MDASDKKVASYTSQHMDIYLLFYITTNGYLLVRFFYLLVGLLFTCGFVIKMLTCIIQHLNGLGIFCDSFFGKKLQKSSLPYFQCVQKKIENFYFQVNHFTQTNQNKATSKQQQNNKATMSSISKIVNILSAKYGFDIKEATEHVKAEIQAYKNMTKEEKDAIKEAEKQAKVAAKEAAKQAKEQAKLAAKQEREAKKAEKASKPKKERTPAQEAAFQKMIAANKAKRDAKLAAQELGENVVVSTESPVNDEAYQAEMNAKFDQHEAVEKKVKKEKKSKKTAETVEVSTLLPPLIQEEAPLEKKVKKEKKSKKPVEESSDDKMLAVFDNL